MATIIQQGNTVLRKKADTVVLSDINTPKIKKILKDMSVALRKESDGVAIAAPQIGVSKRIFIISGHVFDKSFTSERGSIKKDYTTPDVVFINPEFVKKSKTKKWLEEGCLSVRPIYGEVERSTQATVRAYDENGKKFTRGGSGLIAHIFQHEIDHLDGILFIDKARNIKKQEIIKNGA